MSKGIITLCGSTRFKKHFMALNLVLTLSDWIVLSVGSFHHSDDEIKYITLERKNQLDKLHKEKIDLSSIVLVIDVNGYIGSSTESEINYSRFKGKTIYYWSNFNDINYLVEVGLMGKLMELIG